MHTMVAFSESQDLAGVEGNVAAVSDQSLKTSGDEITVPDIFNNIIGAIACIGSTGTRAKLVSPSLRRVNPYEILPIVDDIDPDGKPPFAMHPENPIPLSVNESLEAKITADPAAAEQETVLVFLAPGELSKIKGQIRPVRFSITVAVTAGTFAFSEIAFIDDLPVGNYSVVGASLVVANGVGFRFVPVGAGHRPGAPCLQAVGTISDMKFRNGNLGEWFKFNTVQPPGVEVIAHTAAGSATYYGVMDVIPA